MEDNKTQLIINARVIDGAGQAPFDGAIAVQGNRILSVGAEPRVREAAGPGAEVVDRASAARAQFISMGFLSGLACCP